LLDNFELIKLHYKLTSKQFHL